MADHLSRHRPDSKSRLDDCTPDLQVPSDAAAKWLESMELMSVAADQLAPATSNVGEYPESRRASVLLDRIQ